ncbi:MAG: NAD-dependent epimerase/dehydratase family protein [Betaproteobacteria bacterium]|nr:MAG: NAD-dependent epimerase/dehydratase family protein [Betaproteobacteria bacterium]
MPRVFVTGSAGFIGSNLVDRLLADGYEVVGYDNFSTGQPAFMQAALQSGRFTLVEGDVLELSLLSQAMAGSERVFHLAANADVRFGTQHPGKDLEQNTIATYNVLEAMRKNGIRRIAFSSTGSVYGEPDVFPTPENAPFPVQTSLYAASKLSGEALISAYCEGFGFQSFIFRFVSILGERYTHGHVFDFYKQLWQDPTRLRVLGNGKQRKSYLYVQDCIDAMLLAMEKSSAKVNIFNLGVDDYCEVDNSIQWICEALGARPTIEYTGGDRGWIGDSPFIFLDTNKIRSLGWSPKLSIREGVVNTVNFLRANEWVLEARK